MEKEYFLKNHNDEVFSFRLISKDIYEKMYSNGLWTESAKHCNVKCSMPMETVYVQDGKFLGIMKENNYQGYAIYCTNELFFYLLESNELIFFNEDNSDLLSLNYMLICSKNEVETIKKNHNLTQFGNFFCDEKYYKTDDGRCMILFDDGIAEVFMSLEDLQMMDRITG